ncbi:MAG: glycoside hydrolase family 3 C-terminal domain-containing protein [Bacteroidaceae bacterium]|nr:glycoside hydrolase family 3 C-terminal domain-containing protein [Prevotellaceae bacterium]MDY5760769.1 glycoside hydrolase family 3 C-terminal domain-containing protein [Bacteroidaceae bacterium]
MAMTAMTAQAQTYLDPNAPLEERVKDALSRMTTHEKVQILHAQSKFTSAGVPRLGIRQLNMDDGPHGVREELEWNTWSPAKWTNDYIVAFPSLTCLAATWNRDISTAYGNAVSEEFAFRGKDIMLGPGVNIQRTPLNGRAFEYMGEDPFLAGEIVVPYIKAAQANGIACCLKHFVLNDQETDRFGVNVNVSDRAMREIYLRPFQKAVEQAHVYTIMGSYNKWKGVHCCHNDELLNGILKKEWNWDGALVSDWGGTTNTMEAALGGLDIEMGTYTDGKLKESEFGYENYYLANPFEKLIEDGTVPMSVLDEKASRVLRTIFRTAMNPKKVIGNQCSEAHYDVCRQIGEEGIVLLKNEKNILPLDPSKWTKYHNVLVVGENATRSLTQGGGSSELKTLRDISPLDALKKQYEQMVDYAQGYYSGRVMYDHVDRIDPTKQAELKAQALEAAKGADLIIFIGGLNKNTHQDCENGDREGYDLPYGQNELISELAKIQKNIVVVTFGGNPYAMPWLKEVAAVVHCWYLGSESGTALANVLSGKVCPSGKLPVTFAEKYEDYPYVQYGKEAYPGVNKEVYYKEGIFVGYRHFTTNNVKPLFPFGFGLSYTTFAYGKPSGHATGNDIVISVDVTNTGKVAGKEIVQIYSSVQQSNVPRPAKELKGFAKTKLLQPGESETLHIAIPKEELNYYDESQHGWKLASGTYTFHVGTNVNDIKGRLNVKID